MARRPASPYNPIDELAGDFRLIAMDQRNAGQSRAPIRAADGWQSYAGDQLALMDHLHIDHAHALGACIGVSFILRLFQDAPERLTAGVLQQPIGRGDESESWTTRQVDGMVEALSGIGGPLTGPSKASPATSYEPNFVYSVSRSFVRGCAKPMLVLPGNDKAHPRSIACEVADSAPTRSSSTTGGPICQPPLPASGNF